jgi:single-strand selective monofunctional uracil DNA glycosylase
MSDSPISDQLVEAARKLSAKLERLKFSPPVTHVYNPLTYAWQAHEEFLRRFGKTQKRVIFLGMNPGPFGMVQTGVPFGEVSSVRDWMGIHAKIGKPKKEHPKRLVAGFDCHRTEISGLRLWGLFSKRFGAPENFFAEHLVVNYCPLAFCEESGCNRTPDKLPTAESEKLFRACDEHLRRVVELLQPEWIIGIGAFAKNRAELVCGKSNARIGQILHPSPASPIANRDWPGTATKQLVELGVW